MPLLVYCAPKAGLHALTKAMTVEFGKHKVRAASFNQGLIEIPIGSTGDLLMPMDQVVVNCILFLGSGIAGVITESGMILDGGSCAT